MRFRVRGVAAVLAVLVIGCTAGDDESASDGPDADTSAAADTTPTVTTRPVLEVDRAEVVATSDSTIATLDGVVAGPEGDWWGLVTTRDGSDAEVRLVTSGDGRDWSEVDTDGLPDRPGALRTLVVAPDGAMIVLGLLGDDGHGWRSEDGQSWEPLDDEVLAGLEDATIGTVAHTGEGLVAVAEHMDFDAYEGGGAEPEIGFALLGSQDGVEWELLADHRDDLRSGSPLVLGVGDGEALVAVNSLGDEGGLTSTMLHLAEELEELGTAGDLLDDGARIEGGVRHDDGRWLLGGAASGRGALWSAEAPDGPWAAVDLPDGMLDGEGRQQVNDLAVGPDGDLIVVGATTTGSDHLQQVGHLDAWVEVEGEWVRAEQPLLLGDEDISPHLRGVVVRDDGAMLAYGNRPVLLTEEQRELIEAREFVDRGAAASAWSLEVGEREVEPSLLEVVAVDDDALGGEGEQYLSGIVATDDGLVAVGWDQPDLEGEELAAVWLSDDGSAWERVPTQDGFEGDGEHHRFMRDVTRLPDGALVAVGLDYAEEGSLLSWRSEDDGRTWEVAVTEPGSGNVSVSGVGVVDDEAVAVGDRTEVGDDDVEIHPVAWRSVDGLDWEEVELPGAEDPGDANRPESIVEVDDGVVVIGTTARELGLREGGGYGWRVGSMVLSGPDLESLEVHGEVVEQDEDFGIVRGVLDGGTLVGGRAIGQDDDRRVAPHVWYGDEGTYEAELIDDLGDSFWPETAADVGDWRLLAGTTTIGGGTSLALVTDAGGEWTRLPHDREVLAGTERWDIHGSAVHGDTVVLVGTVGETEDGRDAAVWLVSAPG